MRSWGAISVRSVLFRCDHGVWSVPSRCNPGVRSRCNWCEVEGVISMWSMQSRSRRHDIFLSLSLSLSLFVFTRESRNDLKWKFSLQTISRSNQLKHTVNWKYFPKNLFSMRNQTPTFTEKYFQKWFETKTNTAEVIFALGFQTFGELLYLAISSFL